ncbi:MAG: CTP synthase [Patescibacteria group bacterium]
MAKFIFVTGGVLSGLGKGITAASIGNILTARGKKVFMMKFDQYFNVDAGTLNPAEHGECFVTDDGAETDLDLGHYERFTDQNLTRESSVMSGQIYQAIIENERQGKYLGKTIQMIPHLTDEIKERINNAAKRSNADFVIVEIGGTVGDYEGLHFVEAIRQMRRDKGIDSTLYCHVGFFPWLATTEELKTKPMQNSIRDLNNFGIHPDIVFCRADYPIPARCLDKISTFCNIDRDAVVPLETLGNVYELPLLLEKFNVARVISRKLKTPLGRRIDRSWIELNKNIRSKKNKSVNIALVGKYMDMKDTYYSVTEALKSAAYKNHVKLNILWTDSELVERYGVDKYLKNTDGIVVPGGFGNRGIEGKIMAAKYARENKVPYLGLCLGMQIAVIEFARHALKTKACNSTEFDKNVKNPVIDIMEHQKKISEKGGTMRLGAYPCVLSEDSKSLNLYGKKEVSERHRHRYEFNNDYREVLSKAGLLIAGTSPDNKLVEIIEHKDHPFFVASQFHPEFKSRPNRPHPLFDGFIKAAIK